MLQKQDHFIIQLGSNSNLSYLNIELLHQKQKNYFKSLYKSEITIFKLIQGHYDFYLFAWLFKECKYDLEFKETPSFSYPKEKLVPPTSSSSLPSDTCLTSQLTIIALQTLSHWTHFQVLSETGKRWNLHQNPDSCKGKLAAEHPGLDEFLLAALHSREKLNTHPWRCTRLG